MERRRRKGEKQWAKLLNSQAESGLTVAAFCRKKEIGLASFYQWKRRLSAGENLARIPADSAFLELGSLSETVNRSQTDPSPWMVTLDFGDGLRLTLQRG